MKEKLYRAAALCVALLICLPTASVGVSAKSFITDPAITNGGNYTSDAVLVQKLNSIFAGNIGIYTDEACTQAVQAPLGSALMTGDNKYYVKSNTTGNVTFGWQCYIYANGVYNTLFNEWVKSGAPFAHSLILLGGGLTAVSFALFQEAGVRTGAYIRTTTDQTGKFLGGSGHSLIVLSYDALTLTCLEGNADGNGLARITAFTWDEFNAGQLQGKGRTLCHIVQPTAEYYNSLYPNASAFSDSFAVTFNPDGGIIAALKIKKTITASGMNQMRDTDNLIIYTDAYGTTTGTNQYGSEVVVDSEGRVTAAPVYGVCNNAIPKGGFVLSGHDAGWQLLTGIKTGDYIAREPASLALTVYADKESYLVGTKRVKIGKTYGALPTPMKEGYFFTGWADTAGKPVTPATLFKGDAAVTLKANWAPVTDKLTYRITVPGKSDAQNGLLYNIPAGTTVKTLTAAVCLTATSVCAVYNEQGEELPSDALLATGYTLCLTDNGEVKDTAALSVRGDVDKNGKIDTDDARITLRAAAGLCVLEGKEVLAAADVLGDGTTGINDARKILRVAAKLENY